MRSTRLIYFLAALLGASGFPSPALAQQGVPSDERAIRAVIERINLALNADTADRGLGILRGVISDKGYAFVQPNLEQREALVGGKKVFLDTVAQSLREGPKWGVHVIHQITILGPKRSSAKPSSSKRPAADRRSQAKSRLVWMIVLVGLLGAGTLAVRGLMDDSPKGCVRRFTCNRPAGDWNEAEAYMPDDAVQRFEFERWRVRCFSSILDKHRPKGDTVAIEIEAISGTPRTGVFRVVMTSPSIGRRVHQQHWEKVDGRWFFDAADTVRSHDRPEQSRAISAPEPHASRQ